MKITHHTGRLDKVERGRISPSGNPSFWFHFIDGRASVRTDTDSQVANKAENFVHGEWIRYGVNSKGRMVECEPYDTSGGYNN
jgi:hypothetical protein